MGTLRRAEVRDVDALGRLRAHVHEAMGVDRAVLGWSEACRAALERRLAEPDRFAAFVVEVDGRVDLRATPDGFLLYEAAGFRLLGGASMARTAPDVRPGLGFVG